MAPALENEIIQSGQALHMGEMDPAIPLSPDFDLRYWLEKDLFDRSSESFS
jgi:hypothetical protein